MLDYFYCPNFSSRTWSKTPPVCVVVPSMLTSILLEALAVWLNFGVKVSTLPVIALGVGIGVDYALFSGKAPESMPTVCAVPSLRPAANDQFWGMSPRGFHPKVRGGRA